MGYGGRRSSSRGMPRYMLEHPVYPPCRKVRGGDNQQETDAASSLEQEASSDKEFSSSLAAQSLQLIAFLGLLRDYTRRIRAIG